MDTHTREHVHPWAESREHFYTISYVKETDCLKCGNKGKDIQFISTAEAHVPSGHSSSLFQGYHPSGDASGRVVLLPVAHELLPAGISFHDHVRVKL